MLPADFHKHRVLKSKGQMMRYGFSKLGRFSLACLTGVISLAAAGWAQAAEDRVYLEDGTVLVGELQGWHEGALRIETGFAGSIEVETGGVVGVETAAKRVVSFGDGNRLVGRLVYDEGTQRLVDGPFGELTFDAGGIAALWAEGADPPRTRSLEQEVAAARAEAEAAREAVAADYEARMAALEEELGTYRNPWAGQIELGLSGTTGNSETIETMGRLKLERHTPGDRLDLYLRGRFARSEGRETANQLSSGVKLEVDFSEQWFAFVRGDLETDRIENLSLRVEATGGVGYFWFEREQSLLKTLAGVGYRHETFDNGVIRENLMGELALEYEQAINPWVDFTHASRFRSSFEEAGDFLYAAETAGEIPLNGEKDWKLRIGMLNEYTSKPEGGADRLDTTYFANFVYDFEP